MFRVAFSGAMLAAIALASTASADMWPHRKPGLWLSNMSMQGVAMPPMASKYCIDEATDSALMTQGQNYANKACGTPAVHFSGSSGTVDAVCKFGNMTSTSHTIMIFSGNTAYHGEIRSHIEPAPEHMKADTVMTMDAKWVGPCPANMKPGDMVVPNGMLVHLHPLGK